MQVNAINSSIGFSGRTMLNNNKPAVSNVSFEGEKKNNVSNNSLTNATKALALATLMSLGTAGVTSCDKMHFEDEHIYPIEIPVDTVHYHHYFPVPGENKVDTVTMIPGYDSPVAPIIKDFFEENGIDTGDGKIPARIMYLDEYNNPIVKMLFNDKKSSKPEMWFDVKITEFDEDEGEYIEGKNETTYRVGYSTPDEKNQLVTKLEKLKSENLDTNNELNWTTVSKALYDTSTGKRYLIDDEGNATFNGYFEKGDVANSILYYNEYGSKRRYSSISVDCITPKDTYIDGNK